MERKNNNNRLLFKKFECEETYCWVQLLVAREVLHQEYGCPLNLTVSLL